MKLSNNSSGSETHAVAAATGITAITPSWLKVEPSPERNSQVTVSHPYAESSAGTRPTRRLSVDVVPVPPVITSTATAELVADTTTEKSPFVESSAAAQRRLRQTTFVQSQVPFMNDYDVYKLFSLIVCT